MARSLRFNPLLSPLLASARTRVSELSRAREAYIKSPSSTTSAIPQPRTTPADMRTASTPRTTTPSSGRGTPASSRRRPTSPPGEEHHVPRLDTDRVPQLRRLHVGLEVAEWRR
ncbi:hypothetical protein CSUB01_07399 [Colletotrichum sublineola]|uniref:Uncharacterized protein n=1 Tax=Colletotrichum sublineola TaxID=1173701 RepID=A0A066XGS2_COLSU|nr:hypothetical protein CSUB01_07399 [Colletotrichum sublineola]